MRHLLDAGNQKGFLEAVMSELRGRGRVFLTSKVAQEDLAYLGD